MKVLLTSTNEEDLIKIEGATVAKTLKGSLLRSQGLDLAEIQIIQDVMVIKNEEDRIKIEGAGVATTVKTDF